MVPFFKISFFGALWTTLLGPDSNSKTNLQLQKYERTIRVLKQALSVFLYVFLLKYLRNSKNSIKNPCVDIRRVFDKTFQSPVSKLLKQKNLNKLCVRS